MYYLQMHIIVVISFDINYFERMFKYINTNLNITYNMYTSYKLSVPLCLSQSIYFFQIYTFLIFQILLLEIKYYLGKLNEM